MTLSETDVLVSTCVAPFPLEPDPDKVSGNARPKGPKLEPNPVVSFGIYLKLEGNFVCCDTLEKPGPVQVIKDGRPEAPLEQDLLYLVHRTRRVRHEKIHSGRQESFGCGR